MTARKSSHLRNCDYVSIISSCSHSTLLAKYFRAESLSAPLNEKQRIKDLRLYAQTVIKTANVIISRCCFGENCTELSLSVCRTCSTLIFLHSTNQILNLWRCRCRCRCRSRHRCYSSLVLLWFSVVLGTDENI